MRIEWEIAAENFRRGSRSLNFHFVLFRANTHALVQETTASARRQLKSGEKSKIVWARLGFECENRQMPKYQTKQQY